ncbi:hypothetical protein OG455_17600 [Kitasatospora sp. NBC_01287]|uniref:hypothetical protein n=1 Tax=Kitasatospora sp. NBC_01287 TaxID=2903573 RepID=UPI00224F7F4F|nr:hypothetical protein [Kitasatospora sp. NBC_01287]MCX4747314.1 hypothetical protein [Kitasatospora sp. NBC_01287]
MRLRHTVAAAGALLLVLSVPSSAFAATGEFDYRLHDGKKAALSDPASSECINLEGSDADHAAHSPENFTDATATVFLDSDCNGDTYYVLKPGKKLGEKLKMRSVIFS